MADNPDIIPADSDGEPLADTQVEVNGLVPGEGGTDGGGTDVTVQHDGSDVVSALTALDFVAGVDVSDEGNGAVQVDVQVDTSQIANTAVTDEKIEQNAVTAGAIAAGAVGAEQIDLSISPTWTGEHTFDATVVLADQNADPSSNGEVQRNGSDVLVYSGGSVRNLSNIGSGSGTDTRTNVSDDGTEVIQNTEDINFGTGLAASDDGDGSATVDATGIESGAIADRPSSGDYDDQLYYATDQRILWGWDADASDWTARGGLGSDSQAIPGTTHLESLDTDALSVGSDSALISVAASGQSTLSSGSATVDTELSDTDATFYLALGIDDPDADAKVAGRMFWDDSAGTYKVEIVEDGTSVGNPTVNYDVLRVR